MKTVGIRELTFNVTTWMKTAQKDDVVVTRHNRPVAMLIGVEGKDWYWVFNAIKKTAARR